LFQIAENYLISDLSVDNAIPFLIFSDTHNAMSLKVKSMDIISQNATAILSVSKLSATIGSDLADELFLHSHKRLYLEPITCSDYPNPSHVKVVITNSKIMDLNGVYKFEGMKNNGGFYTKISLVNNILTKFAIGKFKTTENLTDFRWFIFKRGTIDVVDAEATPHDMDTDFYHALTTSESTIPAASCDLNWACVNKNKLGINASMKVTCFPDV
jgi:hypothetical protein